MKRQRDHRAGDERAATLATRSARPRPPWHGRGFRRHCDPASTIGPRQAQNPRPGTRTMKLATYKDGSRDGQLVVVSRDLATGHYASGIATPTAAGARRLELPFAAARGPGDVARPRQGAARVPVRAGALHGAAAARLPVGRRLGLRQPRRAGAAGAQRRDAGDLLDRPADVPGRQRRLPRPARRHRRRERGLGHRLRGRGRGRHRRRRDGHLGGGGDRVDPAGHARQRREPAQPDPGRARQGLRLLPEQAGDGVQPGRGDARRARRRLAAAAASTSISRAPGTASARACATPARR